VPSPNFGLELRPESELIGRNRDPRVPADQVLQGSRGKDTQITRARCGPILEEHHVLIRGRDVAGSNMPRRSRVQSGRLRSGAVDLAGCDSDQLGVPPLLLRMTSRSRCRISAVRLRGSGRLLAARVALRPASGVPMNGSPRASRHLSGIRVEARDAGRHRGRS